MRWEAHVAGMSWKGRGWKEGNWEDGGNMAIHDSG